MAAEKGKLKSQDFDLFNIPELVEDRKWDHILVRLDFLKFYISCSDRKAILRAQEAPVWLKNATYLCKTISSC